MATRKLEVKTEREEQIIDLTEMVEKEVLASGISVGILLVFLQGSTAALTTMEYERGLLQDLPQMLERVAPRGIKYAH